MIRSPLGWWGGLSGPAKFRAYTRLTLQVSGLVAIVTLAAGSPGPAAAAGVVTCGVAVLVLLEVQPGLASWPGPAVRRHVLTAGTGILVLEWAVAGLGTWLDDDALARAARYAGVFGAIAITLAVLPFVRGRWWWLAALAGGTGLLQEGGWDARLLTAATVLVLGGFTLATMLFTLFSLRMVDDLDRARTLEARLQVADERLRFSRDLHDVVGRGFSAIAVKSELAATLSRAGAADRAAAEMDEVKVLAVESMSQMRGLVRGYRDIDLAGEVGGARSLLSAAGCRLEVQGDPARVPGRFHELAAWVTREGTTNIVRHSTATVATLAFGPAGMSLRNDGVAAGPGERSGLRGLAERAAAAGADLHAGVTEGEFLLEIVWEAP